MSRPLDRPDHKPLIALVDRANRALQSDMVRNGHRRGHTQIKQAHNAVFGYLLEGGTRASDMAARAGMTRQSMGEVIRDLVGLGVVEMKPDPDDKRAKLVTYTDYGRELARTGYGHIIDLERRFAEEFGEKEYAIARDVLARVVDLLDAIDAEESAAAVAAEEGQAAAETA